MKLYLGKFITVGLLPMPPLFASFLSFLFFSEICYTLQEEKWWFNEEWILLTDLEAIPWRRLSVTNMWPSIKHIYTDNFFLQIPNLSNVFFSKPTLPHGLFSSKPATKAIGDLLGHTFYHLKFSFNVLLEVHTPNACSYPQQLFVLIIPGTIGLTIGLFVFSRDGDLKIKKRAQSSAPQTSAYIQTWAVR